MKKGLFLILLLFIGTLTVNAGSLQRDIKVWESLVTPIQADAEGNCKESTLEGGPVFDTFTVGADSSKVCVMTAKAEIVYDAANDKGGYTAVGQKNVGSVEGQTYYGSVLPTANNKEDYAVLFSEIVEAMYNDAGKTTTKLKKFAMSNYSVYATDTGIGPGINATDFVIKAGSSSDGLYVSAGYKIDGVASPTLHSFKIDYDTATKKFSYKITKTVDNAGLFHVANFITMYLTDYVMEVTAGYETLVNQFGVSTTSTEPFAASTNYSKIKNDFEKEYGGVKYQASTIELDFVVDGQMSKNAVELLNAAVAAENQQKQEEEKKEETPTQPPTQQETNKENNPNTGSFVSIFAIIALLGVGTVLILGNKRKLFKI